MSYLILFISALGAATLLPLQSEAVLLTLLYQHSYSVFWLLTVASVGNILGSCINWWLGLKVEVFKDKKWFPVSISQLAKAQTSYQRYGFWALLFSWVPIIGDPITVLAGVLKEKFWRFFLMVSLAKTGRYLFIYAVFCGLIQQ